MFYYFSFWNMFTRNKTLRKYMIHNVDIAIKWVVFNVNFISLEQLKLKCAYTVCMSER